MTLLHSAGLFLTFLVLLVAELFIPSGGFLAIAAIAALIAAIIIGFLHSMMAGAAVLVSACVLVPIVVSLGLRIWPRTAIGRRMLNIDPDAEDPEESALQQRRDAMIGKTGVAKTDLLPSGLIELDGRRLDALSLGMAIDRGQGVVVVNVVGGTIYVRPTDTPEEANPPNGTPPNVLETPLESLGIEDFDDTR